MNQALGQLKQIGGSDRELQLNIANIKVNFGEIEITIEGFKYANSIKTERRSLHEYCGMEVQRVEVDLAKKTEVKHDSNNNNAQLRIPIAPDRGEYECSPI